MEGRRMEALSFMLDAGPSRTSLYNWIASCTTTVLVVVNYMDRWCANIERYIRLVRVHLTLPLTTVRKHHQTVVYIVN